MSESNSNNQGNWKNKLEALDNLPDDKFNKDLSWQRLSMRSEKKKKQSKAGWYWFAAACIIAVIATPFIFSYTKPQHSALPAISKTFTNIATKDTNKISLSANSSVAEQPNSLPFVIKKTFISKKKSLTQTFNEPDTILQIAVVEKPAEIINIRVVDTSIKELATAPEKKKLRLVHINDLNNPAQQEMMSQTDGKLFFPLKSYSKETYSTNSNGRRSGADNIIKIKLSSQN